MVEETIIDRLESLKKEQIEKQWEFAKMWAELGELEEISQHHALTLGLKEFEIVDLRRALARIAGAIQALEEVHRLFYKETEIDN